MAENIFSIFSNERFVDLNLYQYGYEQTESLHSYGPYRRNHYLFHYVISGCGTLTYDDQKGVQHTVPVLSGQGFLICPKQVTTYFADKAHPWEYVWLEFDGARVRETLEVAGLNEDMPIYKTNSRDLSRKLMEEMLYIARNATASALNLIGHLYLFLDLLSESSATRKILTSGSLRDFYARESLAFIEQNFQNDITVEDIAANCRLNRTYFSSVFKDSLGKSPQEFLISYRMSKASQLLRMTRLSVADVGNAVGYPNQLHFSRAFKKVYGLSPRAWRNENHITESGTL